MDETRARFLTAIAGRLGEERIVEVHLFTPIRQGVLETGVAVVAVTPDAPVSEPAQPIADESAVEGPADAAVETTGEGVAADTDAAAATIAESAVDAVDAETVDAGAEEVAEASDENVDADADDAESDDDSPYADDAPTAETADEVTPSSDDTAVAAVVEAAAPAVVAIERHVIYTARYRLTRKGPDRGKWQFEVAATADAPLSIADVVARGVTQRAKDVTETERLTGEQIRTLLQEPAWRTAP